MLAATGALLASPSIVQAQGQNGVALVIGNSKYQWEASLPNVRRDAPDVARRFQAFGLKTELVQDAGREAMNAALARFATAARGANFAAFYFAGHGASWDEDTYLVPQDADLASPSMVKTLLSVKSVSSAAKEARHRLMVFDSCRNNPADGWRQLTAQRAARVNNDERRATEANAPPDGLTLFSTAPGRVALDGPAGDNSPFAAALLRHFSGPSVDLRSLPAKVRRELLLATGGRQVLWDESTYREPFILAAAGGGTAAGSPGPASDPSRIIELPKAYAFARTNHLTLPEGLIAHRPASASPRAKMAGSFQFTIRTPMGPSPYLLIVIAVDDGPTAEVISASSNDIGLYWRFTTGTVSGNRLELAPNYGRPTYILDWSDANSGSVSRVAADNAKEIGRSSAYNVRFSRLD